jgi:hypothetical protein
MNKKGIAQGHMPGIGDTFKGRIVDLWQHDAQGWKRRDISFLKHDVKRQVKFEYPYASAKIVLVDTDGDMYQLNFSKPESQRKVCLGTPSRLKPWYQKKGFNNEIVNPDTWVYFRYTGQGNEFSILTEEEYKSS